VRRFYANFTYQAESWTNPAVSSPRSTSCHLANVGHLLYGRLTVMTRVEIIHKVRDRAVAIVISAACGGLLYGLAYVPSWLFGDDKQETNERLPPEVKPDVKTLLADVCVTFTSSDNSKSLEFEKGSKGGSEPNQVTMKIVPDAEKGKNIFEAEKPIVLNGTWAVDESAKTVSITLKDESVLYKFLDPAGICILSLGTDPKMVNTESSWFTPESEYEFMRVGGMLAPLSEPSTAATGPNQRENMISEQGAAEQAQSDKALAPSASSAGSDLLKDRPEVYSAAVGATATAPQGAETAAVDEIQPAVGPSSGTSPASIASTPDAATPATPPLPQSSNIEPVPTVSPQPAPIASPISPAAFPADPLSGGHAPQPTAKPTENVHELGMTNPSAPSRDVPTKVVGEPSTRTVVPTDDATKPRVVVRPAAKHHNSAEPKALRGTLKSSAATPAATSQLNGLY
jgi:hypothetical protein